MESFEQEIIKKLKSGISVIGISQPEEYTPAIPNFIKAFVPQAEEGSPRALVLCLTDDDAKSIHEVLEKATKEIDLTIDLVFDKGSKLKQRNDLFDGTEVIVGTTKRICELYFQNGFNVGKLKLFIVLQMDEQISKGMKGFIARLAESLPKCRQLIFTQQPKEERFVDYIQQFVSPSATVEVKEDNSI